MESRLQDAMKNAANALVNMAEEADKLMKAISALEARVERHDDFNKKMKSIFDEYYGGTI